MKKFVLLAALLAMLAVAAVPALADRNNNNHNHHNNGGGGDPAITQDNEQDADSGDVDQSFTVTGGGDNSNQCVGLQGVANTGNAQNQTSIIQYASEADDFDFDETGSTITVSPVNTTDCTQEVNQAASASG
jgi:opacity protein-like surface antigen